MSQRRTLILVAAIAIGALASFLVWQYVNGVKDDAYGSANRVPVYLVKSGGGVSKGAYGQEAAKAITKTEIPSKFLPPNAITSLDDIRDKVAVGDLVPNQIVVSDMFVDPSDPNAATSFADRLKKVGGKDMTTATIQVDTTHGVAGLLQPGDYVNILVAAQSGGGSDSSSSSSTTKATATSSTDTGISGARYMYQKVEILAVGQKPVPEPGDAAAAAAGAATASTAPAQAGSGLLTLLVPAPAAQYIASASPGTLYLTLVARDYKPVPLPQIDPTVPYPGETAGQLTPYGPNGPK